MPLGIYIQVPFCQTKCTYCNFHTGVFSKSLYQPYVEALCREIAARGKQFDQSIDTVYIGGGTPSLLDPVHLARLTETLGAAFSCSLEESTLEADPETVTSEKAQAWRNAGLNRVSLGAQSFEDKELTAAGRMHRRADISQAVACLRAAGFGNLSLDLIAGLPYQTEESWNGSLGELIHLRPEHVSVYLLEIDEGSRLGREVLASGSRYSAGELPDDDTMAAFYETACKHLGTAGYDHYEISNWALPGYRSRHNLKYWRREPYLGIGAGAHSFDGTKRWANPHDPAQYVAAMGQGLPIPEQEEILTPASALDEELFLGLRLLDGIDIGRIERQYGVALRPRIGNLLNDGLVEMDGPRLRLAPSRIAVSNEVFVELLQR